MLVYNIASCSCLSVKVVYNLGMAYLKNLYTRVSCLRTAEWR